MHVSRLDLRQLRRFDEARLEPGPMLNLLTGDNGAGKSSVLEALHLMAYGRSFRGRVRDGLVRSGAAALEVFIEWHETRSGQPRVRRAGLRHSGQDWDGRLDGQAVASLGELCAALAVVTFEPGSHALVTGGGDTRRRYLDWGLFHVEPSFLPVWRRYARALKQRNVLLKARVGGWQLDAWDQELASTGEALSQHRRQYLDSLEPLVLALGEELVPALAMTRIEYQYGWKRDELPLADALLLHRERDLAAGFTTAGPHRADWRIGFAGVPGRDALSRGQAKLTALLAQAEHFALAHGQWPVVALDDLASELDRTHQRRVLERLVRSQAQVFITGTERPAVLDGLGAPLDVFHVEHGNLTRA